MEIIILGDNDVAKGLIDTLSNEDHNVTIISHDEHMLQSLKEEYDIATVVGHPSHPNILRQAGAEYADMLIAVTDTDEINMVACEVAHALFHTPMKIARIRAAEYLNNETLFGSDVIAIDVRICPEQMVTKHVSRLIQYPGASQVYDFANGNILIVLLKPFYGGVLIGKSLAEMATNINNVPVRVVAIFRDGESIDLEGDTVIQTGDELLFLCESDYVRDVMQALGRFESANKRIMIAGGGSNGFCLASLIENDYQIKLIEQNQQRADFVANQLQSTTVLCADVSDTKFLINENVENVDVFVAVTNDDEANIMSCMQAKRMGVKQVMALVKRVAYITLLEGSQIDVAISPQKIMVGSILAHIRKGDISSVYSLPHKGAEILEVIVHGDENTSQVVGKAVNQLQVPTETSVAGIIRGKDNLILQRDIVIEAEDKVILFVKNAKQIGKIEKLFQVSATFV